MEPAKEPTLRPEDIPPEPIYPYPPHQPYAPPELLKQNEKPEKLEELEEPEELVPSFTLRFKFSPADVIFIENILFILI